MRRMEIWNYGTHAGEEAHTPALPAVPQVARAPVDVIGVDSLSSTLMCKASSGLLCKHSGWTIVNAFHASRLIFTGEHSSLMETLSNGSRSLQPGLKWTHTLSATSSFLNLQRVKSEIKKVVKNIQLCCVYR